MFPTPPDMMGPLIVGELAAELGEPEEPSPADAHPPRPTRSQCRGRPLIRILLTAGCRT